MYIYYIYILVVIGKAPTAETERVNVQCPKK